MAICPRCRCEIQFRVIDGRTVPLGCQCVASPVVRERPEESETWQTTCPKCSASVYFVKHNGGAVWFDSLGPPWEKHPCFADDRQVIDVGRWFSSDRFQQLGRLEEVDLLIDFSDRAVLLTFFGARRYVIPDAEFWEHTPVPAKGDLIGLDSNTATLILRGGRRIRFRSMVVPSRCHHCGHLFTDWRQHQGKCGTDQNRSCGICGKVMHWTLLSAHVKNEHLRG